MYRIKQTRFQNFNFKKSCPQLATQAHNTHCLRCLPKFFYHLAYLFLSAHTSTQKSCCACHFSFPFVLRSPKSRARLLLPLLRPQSNSYAVFGCPHPWPPTQAPYPDIQSTPLPQRPAHTCTQPSVSFPLSGDLSSALQPQTIPYNPYYSAFLFKIGLLRLSILVSAVSLGLSAHDSILKNHVSASSSILHAQCSKPDLCVRTFNPTTHPKSQPQRLASKSSLLLYSLISLSFVPSLPPTA